MLPAQQKGYILQLRKLTALAEIGFIGYAFSRFYKIRAAYVNYQSAFADPIYNLRSAMVDVLGGSLSIKVLAAELAMLRYGLLFWKKEKTGEGESHSFSTHKEFGYIAIWCILVCAVMVETVAFHLLLSKWSSVFATVLTLLSVYGILFFIADLSAILKRKILVIGDQLILRTGFRWSAKTNMDNIDKIRRITNNKLSTDVYFKGGIIKSSGDVLITFKSPVRVQKLYGPDKITSAILMNIDDLASFENIINIAAV